VKAGPHLWAGASSQGEPTVAEVTFEGITKTYPDGTTAVRDMDLHIEDGEFVVLVGPSGCGKTTALRMLAGLEEISAGTIRIGDRVINHVAPRDRDIAMVFQSYALYPHLSVYDNIGFGLKLRGEKKNVIDERVQEAARILGLEQFLKRKPRALSGGQRQRVAMGRAIVRQPAAFLMDEPLSNLDAKLRVQMRAEISKLQSDLGTTTIYVTHDQVEAMTMGDRVAVMRKGELLQVAAPQELYDRPVNLFVGGFIGSPTMNMIEVTLERENGHLMARTGDQTLRLDERVQEMYPALKSYEGRQVVMGIRPEDLEDVQIVEDPPEDLRLRGKVLLREALGSELVVHFEIDAPPVMTEDARELLQDKAISPDTASLDEADSVSTLVGRFDPQSKVREGDAIEAVVQTRALHFFDTESGMAIYDEAKTPEGSAGKAA
jgi:multiple sugar transport system ATP-binding protein